MTTASWAESLVDLSVAISKREEMDAALRSGWWALTEDRHAARAGALRASPADDVRPRRAVVFVDAAGSLVREEAAAGGVQAPLSVQQREARTHFVRVLELAAAAAAAQRRAVDGLA